LFCFGKTGEGIINTGFRGFRREREPSRKDGIGGGTGERRGTVAIRRRKHEYVRKDLKKIFPDSRGKKGVEKNRNWEVDLTETSRRRKESGEQRGVFSRDERVISLRGGRRGATRQR